MWAGSYFVFIPKDFFFLLHFIYSLCSTDHRPSVTDMCANLYLCEFLLPSFLAFVLYVNHHRLLALLVSSQVENSRFFMWSHLISCVCVCWQNIVWRPVGWPSCCQLTINHQVKTSSILKSVNHVVWTTQHLQILIVKAAKIKNE